MEMENTPHFYALIYCTFIDLMIVFEMVYLGESDSRSECCSDKNNEEGNTYGIIPPSVFAPVQGTPSCLDSCRRRLWRLLLVLLMPLGQHWVVVVEVPLSEYVSKLWRVLSCNPACPLHRYHKCNERNH